MQLIKPITLILLLILTINGIAQAQTENAIIAPEVFLRGIRLPDGSVRYTAAIIKPSDDAVMRNLSVEMTLPPDAPFTEMLVSRQVQFDVIRINPAGALTLIWQISRIDGDTPLDSFSFTVAEPLSGEMEFYIEWQNEDRSQQFVENFFEQPSLIDASKPEGQIAPVLEGYAFVMQTGVQVSVPEHPETFIMNVQVLPNEFDPPAELGDVWWCSLLEILGMPEGIAADVIVPLRRPVAPFTALQLFQQQTDGSWKALEGSAIVTADGQYAMYQHPGGVVATGGDSSIQQEIVTAEQVEAQIGELPVQPGETSPEQETPQPTATPVVINQAEQTAQTLSESVILNPAPPDGLVTPPVFGSGGVRVEIIQQTDGSLLQCQVGRVNCALLVRREISVSYSVEI